MIGTSDNKRSVLISCILVFEIILLPYNYGVRKVKIYISLEFTKKKLLVMKKMLPHA